MALEPTATTASPATREATAKPTASAAAGLTPSPEESGTPDARPTVSADLQRRLDEVLNDTAEVRGLKPKQGVKEVFLGRQEMRSKLTNDFTADYTAEEARRDAQVMWLSRFSDNRDLDLLKMYVDFYTDATAGLYDSEEDTLYIIDEDKENLTPKARNVLAHEYVHGLQDQYYDLDKLLPEDSKDYDQQLAVISMVEGDATIADQLYVLQYMTPEERDEVFKPSNEPIPAGFTNAPRIIREGFIFRYTQGPMFVLELLKQGTFQGDFSKVDEAMENPPKSTEQILHPEKYTELPRDEPVPVVIPPLTSTLGAGWTMGDSATFGEFDAIVMLKDNGIEGAELGSGEIKEAERAGAGWGGGQFAYYENGRQALLVLDTRWDDDNEAGEFYASLVRSYKDARKDGDYYDDEGRIYKLTLDGDRVLIVGATDKELVDKALEAVK